MNTPLYKHWYHGKIVRTPEGRKVAARTLARERVKAEEFAQRAALLGKVLAGFTDGKAWIGTAVQLLKKNNGTLVVVTRQGNEFETTHGEEMTFEQWDAIVAQQIANEEFSADKILP